MADEPKPAVVDEPKPDEKISLTQEEFDKTIEERLARERRKFGDKYADYDDLKLKAETLEAEKKKRDEEELTENEKLKGNLQEKDIEIESLKKHKEFQENWENSEKEKIEESMKDLEEEDKDLILSLPLDKQMIMINKLITQKENVNVDITKGIGFDIKGVPTVEDCQLLAVKLGKTHPKYIAAIAKRREARPI